jgi:hypothetical protein
MVVSGGPYSSKKIWLNVLDKVQQGLATTSLGKTMADLSFGTYHGDNDITNFFEYLSHFCSYYFNICQNAYIHVMYQI